MLNLDLLGSPFLASNMQNYNLLTCPNDEVESVRENFYGNFTNIGCLGNSTFSTIAINASTDMVRPILEGNHTSCQISGVLHVPEQRYGHNGFSSSWNPNNDIYLTWSVGESSKRLSGTIMLIVILCVIILGFVA